MKLSKCRNCSKFVSVDVWGQPELWKCLCCKSDVCVWCYVIHTQKHYPEIYPNIHNPDGTLK